jgi:predicted RNA-binding protein associated with RNAse of E/G family
VFVVHANEARLLSIAAMMRPITYEYRRPGKPPTLYEEWLVIDRPDVKVLLLEAYRGKTVTVEGVTIQAAGAPIIWYVFPDRWYDIGRFHLLDESVTGWYTNLCLPPLLAGDHWIGSDLFLDLWQPVDGDPLWLDEDELAAAVRTRVIDRATLRRIDNERAMIALQLQQGAWPPPVAKDVTLDQARALLNV